jgi:hypothetical protein
MPAAIVSHATPRPLDKPEPQVLIGQRFVEVSGHFRRLINWESVSGDKPTIVDHSASSNSWGIGLQGGYRFGEVMKGMPVWGVAGGHYETGPESTSLHDDGTVVHGEVDNYGGGAGARLGLWPISRVMIFAWAMAWYEWNRGRFQMCSCEECVLDDLDENCTGCSECGPLLLDEVRTHSTWRADLGLGIYRRITSAVGIQLGLAYTGMLDPKHAEEGFRLQFGFNWSRKRELIQ